MEHAEIVLELHSWLEHHKQSNERIVSEPHAK